jgi:hypothetical protein
LVLAVQIRKWIMKPFSLKYALAGKPIVTSEGHSITEFHIFTSKKETPLIAIINGMAYGYRTDGTGGSCGTLGMASEKKTGWIAVEKTGCVNFNPCSAGRTIYKTSEQAMVGLDESDYAPAKIEWEE